MLSLGSDVPEMAIESRIQLPLVQFYNLK